jgi:hypothetical protein
MIRTSALLGTQPTFGPSSRWISEENKLIWNCALQRVQNALLVEEEQEEKREDEAGEQGEGGEEGQSLLATGEEEPEAADPPEQTNEDEEEQRGGDGGDEEESVELIPVLLLEPMEQDGQPSYELAEGEQNKDNKTTAESVEKRAGINAGLAPEEQTQLDELLHKMLANRPPGSAEAGTLSESQLTRLVQFVQQLQNLLQENVMEKGGN